MIANIVEALTRFVPRSYFWTCWKVTPQSVAQRRLREPFHLSREAQTFANVNVNRMGAGRIAQT